MFRRCLFLFSKVTLADYWKGSAEYENRLAIEKWNNLFADIISDVNILTEENFISDTDSIIIKKYWLKNSEALKDIPFLSLVHGDFCLDHIFVDNGEFSGLIDFGDAFWGDPLIDLAYFRLKDANKSYGNDNYRKFAKAYFDLINDNYEGYDFARAEVRINLYVTWWAIKRITLLTDTNFKMKFAEKLKVFLKETKLNG